MISAKDITQEQQTLIQQWADEGADLGQIQKRLSDEFQISATYLETRMLIEDLKIKFPEPAEEAEEEPVGDSDLLADAGPAGGEETSPAPGSGKVSVSLSDVTQPGMIANGNVTFSDGESAEWYLDQMGRLGLNPSTADYRPSEADIMAFQQELQRIAGEQGM